MRVITNASRETWLECRRQGIGASDAPIILGLSKYKSPFQLFHEKLGLESENATDREAAEWGLALEPALSERFARETGRVVVTPPPFTIYQHSAVPWMLATIDRWQEKLRSDGDGSAIDTVPLELKTSNWSLDKDWKEEAPIAYQVQVQHQMAVTGSQSASIAALIGGQKFVWLDVARDEDFIQQLLALEMEFWGRLIANDPPPVDASEQTGKTLRRLFARAEEEIIALPTEAIEWDDRLGVVKTELKALQEEEQGLKNKLMFAIGNKTVGQLPNGVLYTFRLQKKAEYVVKASEGRVLRRKGAK